jgi:hypothetical protein
MEVFDIYLFAYITPKWFVWTVDEALSIKEIPQRYLGYCLVEMEFFFPRIFWTQTEMNL